MLADPFPALPLPGRNPANVVVEAPAPGPGSWAGGPSAAVDVDGTFWLAYRLRRPVGEGRGFAVGIARSDDGVTFEEVERLDRDALGCDSLERPALLRRPDGGWRIYLSPATPGTLHWRVVALDADRPDAFDATSVVEVLDGGPDVAYKDPVVHADASGWRMWVCVHHVADPATADAMSTSFATSDDGLSWELHGTVLAPGPAGWDRRGRRISSVLSTPSGLAAYYDGRGSFEENWEERTGIAVAEAGGRFQALDGGPLGVSAEGSGSLRYVDAVVDGDGLRLFYESARSDGAHDLLTEYAPRPS